MPRQQSGQRRAQGGGRTANSEPKLQVFKDFGGMNIENYSDHPGYGNVIDEEADGRQSDLQMNYTFLQNNVEVASNKTLESRDDMRLLYDGSGTGMYTRTGPQFNGPTCMICGMLYLSADRGIARIDVNTGNLEFLTITYNHAETDPEQGTTIVSDVGTSYSGGKFTSFDHYDDKLIALTDDSKMFIGNVGDNGVVTDVNNAVEVEDPAEPIAGPNIQLMGTLVGSETMTDACPFRVTFSYTYVNRHGPTKMSPPNVVYFNHPVSEWSDACYLHLEGPVPSTDYDGGPNAYDIRAVELYYTADNAMSPLFLDRIEIPEDGVYWQYDWYGYVDVTEKWPIANLTPPTENYTGGVHATRMCDIDGRMYFWGDNDLPYRLYIGGNPGNLLSISPGVGGGFVDVEPGTGKVIKHVCKYKTQSGASIVTILCDSENTQDELRFNLVENSIALSNEQSMKSWQAEHVAGAVGCKSWNGAVVCADGLYSISRYGLALTTMTMEYNSQIKTTYVSDPIKPVFVNYSTNDNLLARNPFRYSSIVECDGVLYMAPGYNYYPHMVPHHYGRVIFCYDIDNKAWWTHTINDRIFVQLSSGRAEDTTDCIQNVFNFDWEGVDEGVGIVTSYRVLVLEKTGRVQYEVPDNRFLVEFADISTQMPQQGWQYLSQLEFHFDYLLGDIDFKVEMIDMFGRHLTVRKSVSLDEIEHHKVVRMRIDQRVMSYSITMTGHARFRMTHFIARVYTLSNKIGQVWGFDDSISHRSSGSVHPTFKSYNDLEDAIFT